MGKMSHFMTGVRRYAKFRGKIHADSSRNSPVKFIGPTGLYFKVLFSW